jgi:hypothetical protein
MAEQAGVIGMEPHLNFLDFLQQQALKQTNMFSITACASSNRFVARAKHALLSLVISLHRCLTQEE